MKILSRHLEVAVLLSLTVAGCASHTAKRSVSPPERVAEQPATPKPAAATPAEETPAQPASATSAAGAKTGVPSGPPETGNAAPPTAKAAAPVVTAPAPKPAAPTATPKPASKAANAAAKKGTPAPSAAAPKPAAPTAASPAAPAPLDLTALKDELKATNAIGVFTKLSLKNQVDDLMSKFRDFYQGKGKATMPELRRAYDLLIMKVLSLLQDSDKKLASKVVSSREAIWALLSDRKTFATLQS